MTEEAIVIRQAHDDTVVITSMHVVRVQSAARCIVTLYRNTGAPWSFDASGYPRNEDRKGLRAKLKGDDAAVKAMESLGVF
jgi:hypothetical protein